MGMELPLNNKDRKSIARNGYHRWRNKKRTAKVYIAVLFAMCEGVCPACGQDMILSFNEAENERPNAATLDHILPISITVEHSKYGLQILCKSCNTRKGDNAEAA